MVISDNIKIGQKLYRIIAFNNAAQDAVIREIGIDGYFIQHPITVSTDSLNVAICECENSHCSHGSHHCESQAIQPVKTIYGLYMMCSACAVRLPADYIEA